MREAIILNSSNITTPDSYKLGRKPILERRYFPFGSWQIPLGAKRTGWQRIVYLKNRKQVIPADGPEWRRLLINAERNYPIFLYETDDGTLKPAPLKRIDGEHTRIMLHSDRWLSVKKMVRDLHRTTTNKWTALSKTIIVALLGILGVATVIVSFVLFSKFGIDHTNVLHGFQNQTDTLLNKTTAYVLNG